MSEYYYLPTIKCKYCGETQDELREDGLPCVAYFTDAENPDNNFFHCQSCGKKNRLVMHFKAEKMEE